jgi:hypothetical protein
MRRDRLDIGLYAGAAAAVRAGDCQDFLSIEIIPLQQTT